MGTDSVADFKKETGHRLVRIGLILFLLGLLTGFAIPAMENPRMGLSSHLEGTLNGMLLILFGLLFPRLSLSVGALKWCFWLALYGTYVNWGTTFLAGIWGAGSEMMPFAGEGMSGSAWQEGMISFGLISLSVAIVVVTVMILIGMRGKAAAIE